ncbi:hypothetical protein FEM08_26470 [Flavobacterium gilvum]|nr:hypothetical protein FEM08_26470 [Flavobacterium gilvum]
MKKDLAGTENDKIFGNDCKNAKISHFSPDCSGNPCVPGFGTQDCNE